MVGKAPVNRIFAFYLWTLLLGATACAPAKQSQEDLDRPLRILLDPPPANLNPRTALDATSQRIGELLFRALIRLDSDLKPQPDLAQSWEVSDSGKTFKFPIRGNQKDQAGQLIDAVKIRECLENYRIGAPTSPFRSALPNWQSTDAQGDSVILRLNRPDPYLIRNLSLLRYFRTKDNPSPCAEPSGESALIGSGSFRAENWDFSPETHFTLVPVPTEQGNALSSPPKRKIELIFIQEDDTKSLKLLRGEIDAIQLGLSLTKIRWLEQNYEDRFQVIERPGITVSYLAFNFKDPLLSRKEIRKSIALAVDRASIIRHKHLGFTQVAGSILSPLLPESAPRFFEHNPAKAEKILDQAGFPRKKGGVRFELHYKTTPVREGIEAALIFQNMLRKIGIHLIIDVVEPAVFFASLRKGHFQLYSSRWIGIADGSILYHSLHSGQPLNRIGYQDPEMDRLLDAAITSVDAKSRTALLHQVQTKMAEDLPYFPLWYWKVGLILRKDLWLRNQNAISSEKLSLSGGLEPLTHLR